MRRSKQIYLRAHHLLCLQGYQGYGYDEKFKKNMDKVFYHLNINKNNKNENDENKKNSVILTDYPDDLCNHCPNLIDDKCAGEISKLKSTPKNTEKIRLNNEKIIKMDQKVLEKAKLNKNREYSIDDAISAINKAFYNLNQAKEVCGNCKWENKCLWLQSREP